MAMSHANCEHPRTPAGRRACRAGKATAPVTPIAAPVVTPPKPTIKWTAATVRRAGVVTAKAAKMRAARAAARNNGCVQAALHVGGGRCACGWEGKGCTCGNPLLNARVTGPNAGAMCGPTYCHYALAN